MPKSVEKTRKQISKKKGSTNALHENSRDSQRLRRAHLRDDKLSRMIASRKKDNQPLIVRTAFFQDAVSKNDWQPLELSAVQGLIEQFVHQHDEEYDEIKKARRPGRPASAREDLLRMKIAADVKEYEIGFYLPDLVDVENVQKLERWDGGWAYLPTLKWVRVSNKGVVLPSSFPPKGKS